MIARVLDKKSGHVYRSSSKNTEKLLDLYEEILQKLDKYWTKHTIIWGDYNLDLKHDTEHFSQNLVDITL